VYSSRPFTGAYIYICNRNTYSGRTVEMCRIKYRTAVFRPFFPRLFAERLNRYTFVYTHTHTRACVYVGIVSIRKSGIIFGTSRARFDVIVAVTVSVKYKYPRIRPGTRCWRAITRVRRQRSVRDVT